MDKKILSFEEYAANKKFSSAEEVAETEEETVEVEETEDEESDEHEKLESPEEEAKEEEEEKDGGEEAEDDQKVKPVADQLKECYNGAIKEACDYDKDEYPDHTLESYLKENAALIAVMSANTLEQAHAELKDEALTKEIYEACLNDMKESYNKKMDELKEVWSSK